jgi:hypothetical protein
MPHPKLIVATAGMMMIDDDNVDGGIIHLKSVHQIHST